MSLHCAIRGSGTSQLVVARRIVYVLMCALTLPGGAVGAAAAAPCDLRLTIALTPDVPNVREEGFLSSLVGNHPEYQIALRRQLDSSTIVVDLTGPGPDNRCQDVVEAMRKDGRVLSIRATPIADE